MKYIVLSLNGTAHEVLLNEDPIFPGIPLNERYSEVFLSRCKQVADDYEINIGWLWDEEFGIFIKPSIPEPIESPEEPETPVSPDTIQDRISDLEIAIANIMGGVI